MKINKQRFVLFIVIIFALLVSGCAKETSQTTPENQTPVSNPLVNENPTMTYNEAEDVTVITNGEAAVILLGQWEDKGDHYTNPTYGFVNLVNHHKLLKLNNFVNAYSSSTEWSVAGKTVPLSITTIAIGVTCYNFCISSDNATYQFIYTTNASVDKNNASMFISQALQNFRFIQPEVAQP